VFEGILDHPTLLVVLGLELLAHVVVVQSPAVNTLFGCTRLAPSQWGFCLLVGATSLPVNVAIAWLPCCRGLSSLAAACLAGGPSQARAAGGVAGHVRGCVGACCCGLVGQEAGVGAGDLGDEAQDGVPLLPFR